MELDFKRQIERFSEHIKDEDNTRILFSGIYGSGKTTFLGEFFKENKNYFPVYISPVDYVVSDNEDIYKLIKYDILFHLLVYENIEFEKLKLSAVNRLIKNLNGIDSSKILEVLISSMSNLSETISSESLESAAPLLTLYKNASKMLSTSKFLKRADVSVEEKAVREFYKTIENNHPVLESDIVTSFIQDILTSQKKETVLIIDDLDRIDPEHIFRLLNIFSSSIRKDNPFSELSSVDQHEFKFGFNKVIVVCDASNIKSIYKNRYGSESSYFGYMDKFYSKSIYEFSYDQEFEGEMFDFFKDLLNDSNWRITLIERLPMKFFSLVCYYNDISIRSLEKKKYSSSLPPENQKEEIHNNLKYKTHNAFLSMVEIGEFLFDDFNKCIHNIPYESLRSHDAYNDTINHIVEVYSSLIKNEPRGNLIPLEEEKNSFEYQKQIFNRVAENYFENAIYSGLDIIKLMRDTYEKYRGVF